MRQCCHRTLCIRGYNGRHAAVGFKNILSITLTLYLCTWFVHNVQNAISLHFPYRPRYCKDLPNIFGKIPEITLFYWVMHYFFRISLKMCVMFISSVLEEIFTKFLQTHCLPSNALLSIMSLRTLDMNITHIFRDIRKKI